MAAIRTISRVLHGGLTPSPRPPDAAAAGWLIPGSFFERSENQLYNTAPVIDPSGAVITRYIDGLAAGGNGRSMVAGPDGRLLHQAGAAEELIPLKSIWASSGGSGRAGCAQWASR